MNLGSQILDYVLLALGFGFVIFFHELGHFLAAKYVGIKVEQFAVGFGHAVISWRKGLGFRIGTSAQEYQRRLTEYVETKMSGQLKARENLEPNPEQLDYAAKELGISETEYRLNWIPLGGYVKMLGQDDMKPGAQASDPRAYNMKSIRSRMLVVSAGVIMNIILAAIGFMIVFLIGFNAPPSIVGSVMPGSPAANATGPDGKREGLKVGDRILEMEGKKQYDFTKIALNVALVEDGATVPIKVQHPDGTIETLKITPARIDGDSKGFLSLGITQSPELRGPDDNEAFADMAKDVGKQFPQELVDIKPGDTITAINGETVGVKDYYKLDRALQASGGKPVDLTVKDSKGAERHVLVRPHFQKTFGNEDLNFAGMELRPAVNSVMDKSPALGKLLPGDVIEEISIPKSNHDNWVNPTSKILTEWLNRAGTDGNAVTLRVLRDGKEVDVADIVPSLKVSEERHGLGIGLSYDEDHAVVAGVLKGSPAEIAGIKEGSTITQINGKPVANWFDVKQLLASAQPNQPVDVVAKTDAGEKHYSLNLSQDTIDSVAGYSYANGLALHERVEPRKTSNPLIAAQWGIVETRDFVLQFYLTLQRMFQGSVSHTNMMGPVGIFAAGAKFAYKGTDWLIWFLSMISANLAVVNFLPIPIVDGGLFTFLVLEKIQGRPLSAKAQQIAQFVGLALILGVFLLVTYQDIARMFHV